MHLFPYSDSGRYQSIAVPVSQAGNPKNKIQKKGHPIISFFFFCDLQIIYQSMYNRHFNGEILELVINVSLLFSK